MSPTTDEGEDESEDEILSDEATSNDENTGHKAGGDLKKGPWKHEEDVILIAYIEKYGEGNWNAVQMNTELCRSGKSCRLRWANHLRPNLKKGPFTQDEERIIIELHSKIGNKWARMAESLPGRTDNEIKNFWNTRCKRQERAGLPCYPPELRFQASQQENQIDNTHLDLDISFKHLPLNYNPNIFLPCFPEPPQFNNNFILQNMYQTQFQGSQNFFSGINRDLNNGFSGINPIQDDPCKILEPSFGSSFQYDPYPTNVSFQGSHALNNGNFSASDPLFGVMKSELPSFQCPKPDYGNNWVGTSSLPPLPESANGLSQCLGALDIENSFLFQQNVANSSSIINTPCNLAENSTLLSNCTPPISGAYMNTAVHGFPGEHICPVHDFPGAHISPVHGFPGEHISPVHGFPGQSTKSIWDPQEENNISAFDGSELVEAGCTNEQSAISDSECIVQRLLSQDEQWRDRDLGWTNMPRASNLCNI